MAEPYIEQGLKLHAEKKYEERDKAFEKAIELAPKYDKAYLAYNKALAEKKDWDKLYNITERAIDAGLKENAEIRYYRGLSEYKIVNPYNTFKRLFGGYMQRSVGEVQVEAQMLKSARDNLDFARKNCKDPQMQKDAEKWHSKVVNAIAKWYANW